MKKFFIWLSGVIVMPFVTLLIAFVFVKALGLSVDSALYFLGDSRDTNFILYLWGFLTLISFAGWTASFIDFSEAPKEKSKKAPYIRPPSLGYCNYCGYGNRELYCDGDNTDICKDCTKKAMDSFTKSTKA